MSEGTPPAGAARARPPSLLLPLLATASLGLAPFSPEPHIVKQLVNLAHGQLHAPIDIFDLFMHGAPWLWLLVVLGCRLRGRLGEANR